MKRRRSNPRRACVCSACRIHPYPGRTVSTGIGDRRALGKVARSSSSTSTRLRPRCRRPRSRCCCCRPCTPSLLRPHRMSRRLRRLQRLASCCQRSYRDPPSCRRRCRTNSGSALARMAAERPRSIARPSTDLLSSSRWRCSARAWTPAAASNRCQRWLRSSRSTRPSRWQPTRGHPRACLPRS